MHRKASDGHFLFFKSELMSSFDRMLEANKQVETVDIEVANKGFKPQ